MKNTDNSKQKTKTRTRKDISIRDGRMMCVFATANLLGNIVKLKHIDHKTITGLFYTMSSGFALQEWIVFDEATGSKQ